MGTSPVVNAMNPFFKPHQYPKQKTSKPEKIFIELTDFTNNNYFLHKGWYDVEDLRYDLSKEAIERASLFFREFMAISMAHKCSASIIAFQKLGINKINNFEQAQKLKNIVYELTASACCMPLDSASQEFALRKKAGIE